MSLNKTKIDFEILDSIRGIAALYVMIAHSRGILWMGGNEFISKYPMETWGSSDYLIFSLSMLTRLAVEFVILFFVLSGFSIAFSLRKKEGNNNFYLKRFIRIYPPYVLALIWAGLVFILTKSMHPDFYKNKYETLTFLRYYQMNDFFDVYTIFKNLIYIPMEGFITPFWSLSYEVIFYILAPLILMKRKIYYIVSILLFVIGIILEDQLKMLHFPIIIHQFIFTYNIFFMMGIFLFWNFEELVVFTKFLSKKIHFIILIILLAMMYLVNIKFKMETIYSFIVSSIFAVFLIVYFLKYEIRIRFLQKIGKYSYTLYITHVATLFLLHSIYFKVLKLTPPHIENFWLFIPGIAISLLVAWLLYLIGEKKTKAILEKLRKS